MLMEGVAYRPVSGPVQPRTLLSLAWRRGDASAVLARLVAEVRLTAREMPGQG